MKANVLLVMLALCGTTILFAQEAGVRQDDTLGIHPYKVESPIATGISNWVLTIDAGGNIFDGDFSSEMAHTVYAPTVGLGVVYNFNSGWGIGAEYLYSMYGAAGKEGADNADRILNGQMHRAEGFLTFDIFNVWRPYNPRKLFALNLIAGGGVGWFKNDTYYPDKGHTGSQNPMHDDEFACRSMFLGGADFQFNVSRSISIGVKGVYHFFTKDNIDGRVLGNNNDGIFDFTLSMRYKIDAVHKSHVCNANKDFLSGKIAEETSSKGGQVNTSAAHQSDTTIIYKSDTVVINNTVVVKEPSETEYYVYFENDKSVLTDAALTTIQQVGTRLQRNKNLYVEVIGSCDNTGSQHYNKQLGQDRADNVMGELIEEYDIDPNRMVGTSRGILTTKTGKTIYSPNRRAEIRILTKKQFEEAKQQQQQLQEQQKTEVQQPASKPTATKRHHNGKGKMMVLEPGMTLGGLALQEYGNAVYWIYIYEANKSKIADPNHVKDGTELFVPELTDAQRAAVLPSKYKK